MSKNFNSKTLAIVSTLSLFASLFSGSEAKAQDGGLPSCFRTSGGGTVANIDQLTVGDLCIDGTKIKILYKKCVGSDATAWIDFNRCIKGASNKEIAAHLGSGTVNVCANDASNGGTGGCATGGSGGANNGGNNNGGNNNGGGVASNNGSGSIDINNGGPSNGTGGGRVSIGDGTLAGRNGNGRNGSGDARVNAQTDLNILANHCGEDGDLNDYDTKQDGDARTQAVDNLAQLNCTGDYNTDDCVKLKDLESAMNNTLNACHGGCVGLATNADSACYWDKLKGVSLKAFKTEADFCGGLASNDNSISSSVGDFMKGNGVGDQNLCSSYANAAPTSNKVCMAMLADKSCSQVMKGDESGSSDFQCDGFQDAAKAYFDKKAAIAIAAAKIKQLDGGDTASICNVTDAADATKAAAKKDEVSIKCVAKMAATCEVALEKAQAKVDAMIANCPTCNGRGGGSGGSIVGIPGSSIDARSSQGGTGINKWAQIISAATPLGLGIAGGIFNMNEYNKCTSANASIASQQIALYQQVGLTGPVTTGQCGGMGGGYGGFGGIGGMGGVGGYSPFGGMPGMGGGIGLGGMGGYPGMGYGGMPGLGGIGLGGYGGMPGLGGIGLGGYGGMPGLGGGGYSPIGGGIGLGGGLPGLSGIGGSGYPYSGYGGINQYGLGGMSGIGGIGLGGISGINSSLYGGNAYQAQQNMMQLQQQSSMLGGYGGYGGGYGAGYGGLYGVGAGSLYGGSGYGYGGYPSYYGSSPGISLNAGINLGGSLGGGSCGYQYGVPCSGY